MAGHSKWKNIRIRKGKVDAQKGKLFTKLSKEISIACRAGGPDPEANFRLKDAILRAREASMPNSNIERLLDKARGGGDGEELEELVYEGYGPSGVAIMVETTTNNRNRTAAEMRTLFSKHGGNMGETGCVGWLFESRGQIVLDKDKVDEDKLLAAALEAGALDMESSDEQFVVVTEPTDLYQVREALAQAGFKIQESELTRVAKTTVTVGATEAPAVLKLMDLLEDHDDVNQVYANFDIPADVLEKMEA